LICRKAALHAAAQHPAQGSCGPASRSVQPGTTGLPKKRLERNILGIVGFAPVRASRVGLVEGPAAQRERRLVRMKRLGARAGWRRRGRI